MANDKLVYEAVPKNEKASESSVPFTPPRGFGIRHMQTLILFVCLTTAFTMRSQLSVILVAITDNSTENCNITEVNDHGENCNNQNITSWSVYRTYDWNKSTQEIITFTFFVGYTSMQLPMGYLAQKYGGKIPIMVALGVNGVLVFLTPWTSLIGGWMAVSASRLLQGLTQAAFYPSMHTMLAKWVPLCERARLSTYAYAGSQVGTILGFQISGLLAGSPSLGWPVSFWFFGMQSLLVCGLLGWLGAASPHEHPKITTEELAYILDGASVDVIPKKRKTPWREILKCKAVWGQMLTQAGSGAGYILVLTEIPLYMSSVLGIDIKKNGLYSSLPYIAMYFMTLLFGNLADYVQNKQIMSVVNIRRTSNTIGIVVSGLFLVAFSFTNNTLVAVILLILSLGTHSGVQCGFLINSIDLAPNFAGSIMALGNMIANLTSLLVPVVVSSIVTDVTNQRQWQIVFIIFVAIFIVTNTIFVIFAKGTVQPWNFYGEEENELDNKLNLDEEKKHSEEKEGLNNENNKLAIVTRQ